MRTPEARRRLVRRAALAALCAALAALALSMMPDGPATAADDPQNKLQSVEKAIDETRQSQTRYTAEEQALAEEVAQLRDASIEAARTVQQHEAALTDIEAQLARLDEQQKMKSADLQRRSGESVELLMALERLARDPPEALAVAPMSPLDATRSASLLGIAIPQIEEKAARLREELAALAVLRQEIAGKRKRLAAERDALAAQQSALAAMMARKTALQASAARNAELGGQRLIELSAQARNLHDLIAKLEAERRQREEERRRAEALRERAARQPPRPAAGGAAVAMARPEGLRPFSEARGKMLMPAAGTMTLRFGEDDKYGLPSKGISLATRSGAQVVAPFDGRVEFAGPFRGYGQILIMEHGDGYHSLLAGLDRVECVVGQWLVAGEPVGVMPDGDHGAVLYIELRHHGQPINPLPWLATRDDKVSG